MSILERNIPALVAFGLVILFLLTIGYAGAQEKANPKADQGQEKATIVVCEGTDKAQEVQADPEMVAADKSKAEPSGPPERKTEANKGPEVDPDNIPGHEC